MPELVHDHLRRRGREPSAFRPRWECALALALAFGVGLTLRPDRVDALPPERAVGPAGLERGPGRRHHRFDAAAPTFPSARYAALAPEEALAELRSRHIGFDFVEDAEELEVPVRLVGALHGVRVRMEGASSGRASRRALSPFEIFDARLLLALDDWAARLAEAGVEEVAIFSAYRPHAQVSNGRGGSVPSGHASALALDVRALRWREPSTGRSRWLEVEQELPPEPGAPPCPQGPTLHAPSAPPPVRAGSEVHSPPEPQPRGARPFAPVQGPPPPRSRAEPSRLAFEPTRPLPDLDSVFREEAWSKGASEGASSAAREGLTLAPREVVSAPPAVPEAPSPLRELLCVAVREHLFTIVLTPNYDRAHRNHLHLELRPRVEWTLVR